MKKIQELTKQHQENGGMKKQKSKGDAQMTFDDLSDGGNDDNEKKDSHSKKTVWFFAIIQFYFI